MNFVGQGDDPSSQLLFVNFNQDCTSLVVGTRTGYKILSLNAVDKLDSIYDVGNEDICIVERLFSSSLVAIVSLSSPRKLKVCHFKKGTEICNYSYSNTILAVRLNRLRLIVCLEESLYIHNIRDMKLLHSIRDTPPNPCGLCALSISNEHCYLSYPGSNSIGEIQVFDCVNLRAVIMIPAHDNPLAALTFNSDGTKISSASEKGTVIRVFSVPDGQKLFEFRRGVKRCATIYSIAFSFDSMFLCTSSNTESVHIFKLETQKKESADEPQGWMGYVGQAIKTSANMLPSNMTEMFNQGRDHAIARLPFSGLKNVCALAVVQKMLRLLIASQDGYLYVYNLDPTDGGECTLLKQHKFDGITLDSSANTDQTVAVDVPYISGLRRPDAASSSSPVSKGGLSGKLANVHGNTAWNNESYATVLKQQNSGYKEVDDDSIQDTDQIASIQKQTEERLDSIRIDDDNEFPPITHKTE